MDEEKKKIGYGMDFLDAFCDALKCERIDPLDYLVNPGCDMQILSAIAKKNGFYMNCVQEEKNDLQTKVVIKGYDV
jgi:hypothetical protein